MAATYNIQPIGRFAGECQPVKRPKEFACFSYDDEHRFCLDDSSLKYYYTPQRGADLSVGFQTFDKQDDTADEHIDSLLKAIMGHEQEQGAKIDAKVVTWRGMMTKILATPFDQMDGFEMNATLYQDSIFMEENNEFKVKSRQNERSGDPRRGPPLEVMQFWGYKFETLSTLPRPWGETSRDFIEGRETATVSNRAQYCSVVRTGIGKTVLCLGGEVDAIWDSRPKERGSPTNWVELKTTAEIRNPGDERNFHRKLMKYWIQSFLLGVPKIVVGFRSRDGILLDVQTIETQRIPDIVNAAGEPSWNADMCVNFAGSFLEWLIQVINDEGVWRISRQAKSPVIEIFKIEETGHGNILSQEFKDWRIKLALGPEKEAEG